MEIVGLNSEHLTEGSSKPPKLINGKIRLYSMRFCPYAERVLIALQLKRIQFEVVNINLQHKPQWYYNVNPTGKVPTLEHDGKIIYESLICVDYLHQVFNDDIRILPTDPYERAKQKMLVERLSGLAPTLYQWYKCPTGIDAIEDLFSVIKLHEDLLLTPYFCGDNPGYTDYMIWPWLERLSVIEILSDGKLVIDFEKYPKLSAYIEKMKVVPEISTVSLNGEIHAKFIRSRLDGEADYNVDI